MTHKIDFLEKIVAQKKREVEVLRHALASNQAHPLNKLLQKGPQKKSVLSFVRALEDPGLSIIAEIKRCSPSKGVLAAIADPVELASCYEQSGAAAISILTDHSFFGGSLEDLSSIARAKEKQRITVPLLRKDFIIDPLQVAESALTGADAILAIIAILGESTSTIIEEAAQWGLDVLVEVHDAAELQVALDAGATIIGVNNRNLKTFEIDLQRAFELVEKIPNTILKVAESGIANPQIAERYYKAGFDAVLVGEALVLSHNPQDFFQKISSCKRS
ncbi:MAG: indole-3-glycerol phosphate synthase TrpC [Verrucomicrobiae bacterium]|jgi:indole-3-glycerol phosphate synthase|nr:indole-3-glycerol phosphate synthase TrpC [Verrucomicrobiae bacterium]